MNTVLVLDDIMDFAHHLRGIKLEDMNRKIKLIWDFRGLDALEIAKHHDKHLQEFIRKEELSLNISGHQFLNENHSIAFLVVEEKNMLIVRDALLPHRAEVFNV